MTADTCDRSLNESYGNEISVSIGSSITFECTCLNDTAQWELNGVDISNNTHYIINATSGTLTIPVVRSSDNGTYICNSSSVSLTVTSKYNYATLQLICTSTLVPTITISGQHTELAVGSSVGIICTTIPLIPNSEIKWQSSNSDSNELIINPVMLSHNNKTFTCVVSSDLFNRNLTENVTITVLG